MRKQEPVEKKIGKTLKKKKKTLGLAESCTGGLASHRITNVSGSSNYYRGGVVAYSNDIKSSILGVSPHKIKKYGAVSREVALDMAKGAKRVLNSDIAAAITGIAGPGGGSSEKPVGLAFIALSSKKQDKTKKILFKGERELVKEKFTRALLEFVSENI